MESVAVQVDGHQVMTYSIGQGERVLLLVHGGPGCPCDYLIDSHACFAEQGFRVVSWDQLGCGQSDRPSDKSLWQLPRFVEELETVRSALNLGKVNLLGQSWGGVLGLEYCFAYPEQVNTFIAADTAFDLPRMQRGFEHRKRALGEATCTMMALREAEGTTAHPEYQAAQTLLMYRHMCRLETWPETLNRSISELGHETFATMFGPYFFNCSGNIRDYNRLADLSTMQVPTLIIHGEHDYIMPELACMARDNLPHAELAILRSCSHMPFYEQPQQYQKQVLEFLRQHVV